MRRKGFNLGLIAIAVFCLQSCYTTSYGTVYNIGLSAVESPADAKKQFGETKVVNYEDENVSKYKYEDDFIEISWYVNSKRFMFDLVNKTDYTIKINWDEVTYINPNGEAKRVIHEGVKYADRNETQAITTIPRGARISDFLIPSENIEYNTSVGWVEKNIIPVSFDSKAEAEASLDRYKGKKLSVMMPLKIENVQNDYLFEFKVGDDAEVEKNAILDVVNTTYASTILGTLVGTLLIWLIL